MQHVQPPIFRAELRPNASSSPRALLIVAWLLGGLAGATGTVFLLLGAWPVLPFMGVEIGAALLLLRWHARASAREVELLELTEDAFRITRTDRHGRVRGVTLEPYWLRAEMSGRPARVWLASHGRRISVGNALTEDERRELHGALTTALARWRG
jgi:uncharacterized membrane protein